MPEWLLLIHQLPPTPNYLRVKVARRMQRIGAVAIKNTVYALPATESALEDFQWTVRQIRADGGEANLFEARVIEGLSDGEIQQLFNAARDEDYEAIASEARSLDREDGQRLALDIVRLRKRIADVQSIDFFGAPKGQLAVAVLEELARSIEEPTQASSEAERSETYRDRTWVTRAGVHVDRMASAWLIRRFVDPEARFKFVTEKQYAPKDGEVRFDMFNAEFTHEGDRCTFEVLIDRMSLDDPALRTIAEVVHDIDLKEAKFDRPETSGIAVMVASIAMAHRDDEERIARAAAVLEDLYVYYQKKR
ncbi:MAG TPA: chromate resistance protein ChrB domain-containing protein [Thermoanaerobaculia bacterium]|nr:chromate resistance protein ChrB domain-containing protein [Thermoanaerobaculia bacterium]